MMRKLPFFLLLFTGLFAKSQVAPENVLVGYWHNWNAINSPYIPLDQVDDRYNVLCVSFALPKDGSHSNMEFIPLGQAAFSLKPEIQTVQSEGKKVLISIGGATGDVKLTTVAERDSFITSMTSIIDEYKFDGLDIDIEGHSLKVTGGTIENPIDSPVVYLIEAIEKIMENYRINNGKKMLLTMAPEASGAQGGYTLYTSIWGSYLPLFHHLRDSLEYVHPQLYNSGPLFGLDNVNHQKETEDFIVATTEMLIRGFNTQGGYFQGLGEEKVVIGLPACDQAAGSGYVDTALVGRAVRYLKTGSGKPGNYSLIQSGGYPKLRGLMTWSVNWDAVSHCGGVYPFADSYERLFPQVPDGINEQKKELLPVFPNPVQSGKNINLAIEGIQHIDVYSVEGQYVQSLTNFDYGNGIPVRLSAGSYFLHTRLKNGALRVSKLIVR